MPPKKYNFDFSFLDDNYQPKSYAEKYFGGFQQLFPEKSIPKVFREGYNRSIEGLAYKALTGREFYSLGSYTPGMMADIGATIVSFITPADLLTMGAGSFVGKLALKPMLGKTADYLVKSGFKKSVAQKAAQDGAEQALSKATTSYLSDELAGDIAGVVGGLGFYSGLQSAELQYIEDKDISGLKTLWDATKGGLTAFAGATGAARFAQPIANKLGAKGKLTQMTIAKGVEVGAFGTSPAVFETLEGKPRFPHPSEYVHAAGVIGGLTLGRTALGKVTNLPEQRRLKRLDIEKKETGIDPVELEAKRVAEADIPLGTKLERFEGERFSNDKDTSRITTPGWEKLGAQEPIRFELLDSKDPSTKQKIREAGDKGVFGEMTKGEFLEQFTSSSLDPKGRSPTSANESAAKKAAKALGLTTEEFNLEKSKAYNNDNPTVANARNLRIKYEDQVLVKDHIKRLSKDESFRKEVAFYRYGSTLKNILPPKLYKIMIEGLSPGASRVTHPMKKTGFELIDNFSVEAAVQQNYFLHPQSGLLAGAGYFKASKAERDLLFDVMRGGESGSATPYSGFSRNKLLSVAHAIQRELGITDKQAKIIKKQLFNKDSLSKASDAEIISYMNRIKPSTEKTAGEFDGFNGGRDVKKGVEYETTSGKKFMFKDIDPRQVRAAFDIAYARAQRAGIKTAEYEKNYVPEFVKLEVLDLIRGNINKMLERLDPNQKMDFFSHGGKDLKSMSKVEQNQMIKNYLNEIGVSTEFKELIDLFAKGLEKGQAKDGKRVSPSDSYRVAFGKLKDMTSTELFDRNFFLTKERTLDLPPEIKKLIIETDMDKITTRYFAKTAKSIAHTKHLGKDGEHMNGVITAIDSIGLRRDANVMSQLAQSATGAIEWNPSFNWSPGTKNLLQDFTNFQVATKIGLGFAVIPNLSQVTISTALKTGYAPIIRGTHKYYTDPKYREFINSVSYNYKDIFAATFGHDIKSAGVMGKFAQHTTERFFGIPGLSKISFNKINEMNFKMSAVSSYEYLLKQQGIAQGKGVLGASKKLREKAVNELKRAGFEDITTNLKLGETSKATYEKLQAFTFKFARDYQLQKNVLRDPLFANDPRFRPFFLFKRFGYRQFDLFRRILGEEKANPALILRLAASGVAGAAIIAPAKEMLSRFMSGEDVYSENFSIRHVYPAMKKGDYGKVQEELLNMSNIVDALASVGAMGTVTDIVAAENTRQAIEFAVAPVLRQDADKAYKSVVKFAADTEDFGIGGAIKRAPKNLAPIFGTGVRRLAQRVETKRQRSDYLKYRKGVIRGRILDSLIMGNTASAKKILGEWNRVYGYENPILLDDVDFDDVFDRLIKSKIKSLSA